MKTSEMAKRMRSYIDKLVELFLDRNMEYAGEEVWAANFIRNAEISRIMRLDKIVNEPYGQSIRYSIDKIDRAINGILAIKSRPDRRILPVKHLGDSIDDAQVYLFITKMLLVEAGLIKEEKQEIPIEYLAGIVDGEGTITIHRQVVRGIVQGLKPRLIISNTSLLLIEFLRTLGFSIRKKTKPTKPNHTQGYHAVIDGLQVKEWLIKLYPYLKVKQELCSLVIEFCKSRGQDRHSYTTMEKYIYKKVFKLNTKGKVPKEVPYK